MVEVWSGGHRSNTQCTDAQSTARVPVVRVKLVQATRFLPQQTTVAQVYMGDEFNHEQSILLEAKDELEADTGLQMDTSLIKSDGEGNAFVLITNTKGYSLKLEADTEIGHASNFVQALDVGCNSTEPGRWGSTAVKVARVCNVTATERGEKLMEMLYKEDISRSCTEDQQKLYNLLQEKHRAFALSETEQGRTDLIQFKIDTGDAVPKRQQVRRVPFAVRQEIQRQIQVMEAIGAVQPSDSPWASPIVLVRKKDGTLRFCVDYQGLNSVTKKDNFPLPRIDDLLDQIGESRYFSTLDLASGYWQIAMDPNSREKTAFITHSGLYEFLVMPFGLCNAPSAFQRLMNRVLCGLNPEDGPMFVAVYLDDVLIFSRTMEEHLVHLQLVLDRIIQAGLKLRPSKCHFVKQEVRYLGHTVTPDGLKPNDDQLLAVKGYPPPQNVKELRRFLGLASYYRRFIKQFAKIAHPLHALTCKGAEFAWTEECQIAFDNLKGKLVTAPVLAFPNFDKSFVLETDASIKGLGAVLSQQQEDGQLHPVAFASRALSQQEKNYSVTDLETLAVVWAVSHFHAYLYGHDVEVRTDHSAVKAVLSAPSPNGKHARWWSKVYSSGVRAVTIIHRAGKENLNADALSRNPHGPPLTVE